MPLSREQVRHVAQLARIALEPGDEEFYAEQLSGILAHIDRLQEVPTDDIAPTAQVVEVTNPLREDIPRPGLTQEEALANAPAAVNGFFRVPSIQEEASARRRACCGCIPFPRRSWCRRTWSASARWTTW